MWEIMIHNGSEMVDHGVIKASNIRQLINELSNKLSMTDLVYEKDNSVRATTYQITSKSNLNFYMVATKYN